MSSALGIQFFENPAEPKHSEATETCKGRSTFSSSHYGEVPKDRLAINQTIVSWFNDYMAKAVRGGGVFD